MDTKENVVIKVELEVELTQEDIDDIMCGALEGGIFYWARRVELIGDFLGEYMSEQISRGGKLIIYDRESEDKYELDLEKFKKGVMMWVANPVGCNCLEQVDGKLRFDCCNADAVVCDAIIQYALFGDVIYG